MKEDEEVVFLFPSHAAFGYSGNQEKIGVNQPLIYKVKLNKINIRK
jgi:FKBP-type peptidyl-prolyl cis-trans isomerase